MSQEGLISTLIRWSWLGLGILALGIPRAVWGIGLTPSGIEVHGLLPGQQVERVFYVVRGHPASAEQGIVKFSGPLAGYVRLKNSTTELKEHETQTPVPFIINTGKLGAGTYLVPVKISAAPAPKSGNVGVGSGVVAGVQGTISFSVTNDAVESYVIQAVSLRENEKGAPFGFTYVFVNTGNVDSRPTRIELSYVDLQNSAITYSEVIPSELLPLIPAFSQQVVHILAKAQPDIGNYQGRLIFYGKDGQVVFQNDNLLYQIWPRGTLAQKGQLEAFQSDKRQYKPGETVKLSAQFRNIGQVSLQGKFVMELFHKNTRLDVVQRDAGFLPVGATAEFEEFFRPQKGGAYRAVAYVTYGPFKGPELVEHFRVGELRPILLLSAIGAITVVLALILGWRHWRKNKKAVASPRP